MPPRLELPPNGPMPHVSLIPTKREARTAALRWRSPPDPLTSPDAPPGGLVLEALEVRAAHGHTDARDAGVEGLVEAGREDVRLREVGVVEVSPLALRERVIKGW